MHKKNDDFDIRFLTILSVSLLAILALIFMVNLNVTGNTTATGKTISGMAHYLISDNPAIELNQILLFLGIILILIILVIFIKRKAKKKTREHKRKIKHKS